MSPILEHKITKEKPSRQVLITLAVSAPVIFLVIWLVG
jgi:hypothetical protein